MGIVLSNRKLKTVLSFNWKLITIKILKAKFNGYKNSVKSKLNYSEC